MNTDSCLGKTSGNAIAWEEWQEWHVGRQIAFIAFPWLLEPPRPNWQFKFLFYISGKQ